MTTVGTYIGDAIREGRNEFLLYLMRKTWQKLVMNMFGTCFAVPPKLLHATSSRITSKLPLDRKSVFYLQNLASADSWRHWPPKHRYRSIRKERERERNWYLAIKKEKCQAVNDIFSLQLKLNFSTYVRIFATNAFCESKRSCFWQSFSNGSFPASFSLVSSFL